ncbi:hypothetical protein DFJ74DRAFT_679360 [Hyaloraphidium curvatum]|nr:hypothetical protein DFJ74DRAFT_679360 [Hyaloraphidium curvatum]
MKSCKATKGTGREYSFQLIAGTKCDMTEETQKLKDATKIALCPCEKSLIKNLTLPCTPNTPATSLFYFPASKPVATGEGEVGVPAFVECDRLDSVPLRANLEGTTCTSPPATEKFATGWELLQFLEDSSLRLRRRQAANTKAPAAAKYLPTGVRADIPALGTLVSHGCSGNCAAASAWAVKKGELVFVLPAGGEGGVGRAWAEFKVKVAGEQAAELVIALRSSGPRPLSGLRILVSGAERAGPVRAQPGVIGYAVELPGKTVSAVRFEYVFAGGAGKARRAEDGAGIAALAVRGGEFVEASVPEGEVTADAGKPSAAASPTSAAAAATEPVATAPAADATASPAASATPALPPGDVDEEEDDDDIGAGEEEDDDDDIPGTTKPPHVDDSVTKPPATDGGSSPISVTHPQSGGSDDEPDALSFLTMGALGAAGVVGVMGALYVAYKWRRGPPVTYTQLGSRNGRGDKIELNNRGGDDWRDDWNWEDEDEEGLDPRGER